MPKKFAVATSSGVMFLKKVVREKVKLVIPMLTAVFILAGGGKVFTEAQIVALAAQPAINVTVSAGNQNDGKMYSDNWKLDANNDWEYYENGKVVKNAWVHDHGQWYLVGDNGKMRTGLYESYGKYYLLDDVRGTGTYGKLLKNGGTYKGVTISADTSSDYEGALSEDTLNRLSAVGVTKDKAVGVSGTQHAGQANTDIKTNNRIEELRKKPFKELTNDELCEMLGIEGEAKETLMIRIENEYEGGRKALNQVEFESRYPEEYRRLLIYSVDNYYEIYSCYAFQGGKERIYDFDNMLNGIAFDYFTFIVLASGNREEFLEENGFIFGRDRW